MIDHSNNHQTRRNMSNAAARRMAMMAIAGAAAAWCVIWPTGCSTQDKFELPPSVKAQVPLNERIRKAHELALAAQSAESSGDTAKAIKLYQQAIEVHREFPAAWLNLGVLQMKMKNNLDAVDAFSVASELDADDPRPYFNIATIYDEKRYYKEAIKQYNNALEKDPNLLPALRRSIYLEMQTGGFTPATKDRVMRALMIEKDPQYINLFSQAKIRIDNEVVGGETPPEN